MDKVWKGLAKTDTAVTLGTWLYQHWQSVLIILSGGGVMTLAAYFTEWLKPWGPVGWVYSGIIGALSLAIVLFIFQLSRGVKHRANLDRIYATQTDRVNPLVGNFSRLMIDLKDFFDPSLRPYNNSTFEDCRLRGPAVVAFQGHVHFDHCHFQQCNFVVVDWDSTMTGLVVFHNPKLVRCDLYHVTIVVDPKNARLIRDTLKIKLSGFDIDNQAQKSDGV